MWGGPSAVVWGLLTGAGKGTRGPGPSRAAIGRNAEQREGDEAGTSRAPSPWGAPLSGLAPRTPSGARGWSAGCWPRSGLCLGRALSRPRESLN